MVVKKISFVFIVLAIAIVGTAISSALAADDAAKLARRDKMIAALKAEYAAKVAAKKAEVTEIVVEKEVEATEKISEVKDAVEAASEHPTEAASEHPTEATEKLKAEIAH